MQPAARYRAPSRVSLLSRPLRRPDWLSGGGLATVALGLLCGSVIALLGINGLYLCLSLVGAGLILFDFRIGVVIMILLMPISGSDLFPHAILGITGLNPLNLLLAATLGSYMLQAVFDGKLGQFVPAPLLWLYIVPLLVAAVIGSRHVDEIVPGFITFEFINYSDAAGYLRDTFAKPLLLVIFSLLIAAAVARSARPQRFLLPTFASIWLMALVVIYYVIAEGGSIDQLAQSTSREFLSTSVGVHANELGRLYTFAYAVLLFTWARTYSPTTRLVLIVSTAMVITALLFTFSRAAFASVMLVNVLYLLHHRNGKALLVLGMLCVAGLLLLPEAVYERMATGFGSGLNAITAGRLEGLWIPLLPEVLDSPIWGSGLSSILWSDAMHEAGGTTVLVVTHPHNAYLEALLDVGLLGLAMILFFFFHIWRGFVTLGDDPEMHSMLRGFYEGAAAGLISFMATSFMGGSLAPRPEQAFLWVAIGLMYGQRLRPVAADER